MACVCGCIEYSRSLWQLLNGVAPTSICTRCRHPRSQHAHQSEASQLSRRLRSFATGTHSGHAIFAPRSHGDAAWSQGLGDFAALGMDVLSLVVTLLRPEDACRLMACSAALHLVVASSEVLWHRSRQRVPQAGPAGTNVCCARAAFVGVCQPRLLAELRAEEARRKLTKALAGQLPLPESDPLGFTLFGTAVDQLMRASEQLRDAAAAPNTSMRPPSVLTLRAQAKLQASEQRALFYVVAVSDIRARVHRLFETKPWRTVRLLRVALERCRALGVTPAHALVAQATADLEAAKGRNAAFQLALAQRHVREEWAHVLAGRFRTMRRFFASNWLVVLCCLVLLLQLPRVLVALSLVVVCDDVVTVDVRDTLVAKVTRALLCDGPAMAASLAGERCVGGRESVAQAWARLAAAQMQLRSALGDEAAIAASLQNRVDECRRGRKETELMVAEMRVCVLEMRERQVAERQACVVG